jgi:hypothetical protein
MIYMNDFSKKYKGKLKLAYIINTKTPARLFPKPFNVIEEIDLLLEPINEVVEYLSHVKTLAQTDIYILGILPPLGKDPKKLLS